MYYAAKNIAVLHLGLPGPITDTLRRATQGEINNTNFTLIDMLSIGFHASTINCANMVYLVDMAVWPPILQDLAKKLILMPNGPPIFLRIDIFACPWPSPWIVRGLSDTITFLDYLPLISLHAYSEHYIGV